jgi:hypothetical protein
MPAKAWTAGAGHYKDRGYKIQDTGYKGICENGLYKGAIFTEWDY